MSAIAWWLAFFFAAFAVFAATAIYERRKRLRGRTTTFWVRFVSMLAPLVVLGVLTRDWLVLGLLLGFWALLLFSALRRERAR